MNLRFSILVKGTEGLYVNGPILICLVETGILCSIRVVSTSKMFWVIIGLE